MDKNPSVGDQVVVLLGNAKGRFGKVVQVGVSVDGSTSGYNVILEGGGQTYFAYGFLAVLAKDKDGKQKPFKCSIDIDKITKDELDGLRQYFKRNGIEYSVKSIRMH